MPVWDHYSVSIPGNAEAVNEDYVVCEPDVGVFVVADGMGGRPGGAEASRVAAQTFVSEIRRHARAACVRTDILVRAVDAAGAAVRRVGSLTPELAGLGSTLLAVILHDETCRLVHVGDCRAYLFRNGGVQLLTRDQTLAAELVSRKVWDDSRARRHPLKNVLVQVVGGNPPPVPVILPLDLCAGDCLLLATDGVTKAVGAADMRKAARHAADCTAEAVGSMILRAFRQDDLEDDLSFITIHMPAKVATRVR